MIVKLSFVFGSLLIFVVAAASQAPYDGFKTPWNDPLKPLVLDPYRGNKLDFAQLATEKRVLGIIHKASECLLNQRQDKCDRLRTDLRYDERKRTGKPLGYLWGSYHLGRSGLDPVEQADYYLEHARPADDEVMALDIEGTDPRKDMSLPDAVKFINRIKEKTGRYPLLYTVARVVARIDKDFGPESVFTKTPIWYARYCDDISCYFPNRLWSSYVLWQFASEINCPTKPDHSTKKCTPERCPLNKCPLSKPIAGTDYQMDVNVFNGTFDELKSKWPFTRRD